MDAVFISFSSLCPAQSGLTELYISTDPEGLGPLHQLPLTPRSASAGGGGVFQEVQSLNKREPFRTRSPAAHKQKSLLPVSVTALIQAQTDPPAGEGGFPCCTSIATVRVHYIYVLEGVRYHLLTFLGSEPLKLLFLFDKTKMSNMYFFPEGMKLRRERTDT